MNTYEQDLALAHAVASAVAAAGGRAYFVGGYVRDALMGQACKDIDIEVYGLAPQQLRALLAETGSVLEKGASFGVFSLNHSNLDIAMPRIESRIGAKHTDFAVEVDPYLPPQRACRRRDFTVNAMLMDVLTGEVLDFYGGREDLRARIIRCVAADTFVEDALRAFRAAQFAARLNAQISPATLNLCASMDVHAISTERIFAETEKALLKAEAPSVYFRTLYAMDHLREFFPELQAMIGVKQNPKFPPRGMSSSTRCWCWTKPQSCADARRGRWAS